MTITTFDLDTLTGGTDDTSTYTVGAPAQTLLGASRLITSGGTGRVDRIIWSIASWNGTETLALTAAALASFNAAGGTAVWSSGTYTLTQTNRGDGNWQTVLNAVQYYDASGSAGTRTITVTVYDDDNSLSLARTETVTVSVSSGGQNITAALFQEGDNFYAAAVSATYGVTGALFQDADSIFAATVSQPASGQEISGNLVQNVNLFYGATVTSTYAIAGAFFGDDDQFYGATVSQSVSGALFEDDDWFGAAALAVSGETARSGGPALGPIRETKRKKRPKQRIIFIPEEKPELDLSKITDAEAPDRDAKPEPARPLVQPTAPFDNISSLKSFVSEMARRVEAEARQMERLRQIARGEGGQDLRFESHVAREKLRNDDEEAAALVLLIAA